MLSTQVEPGPGFVSPSSTNSTKSVSELLGNWQAGNDQALQAIVPLVYKELRRLAHYYLRQERPDHTLQGTALVHEVYLRLQRQGGVSIKNRAHLLAISAQMMRQILIEYARGRRAAKRDGGYKITLDDAVAPQTRNVDLLVLDDALQRLSQLDPQQSRIVELRFFGGLSIQETAGVMGMSPATVKRHWSTARLWLHREISGERRA